MERYLQTDKAMESQQKRSSQTGAAITQRNKKSSHDASEAVLSAFIILRLFPLFLGLSLVAAHVRIRHDRHFTLAAPRHECGEGGTCGLPVQCPARVSVGWGGDAHCELPSGGVGVCCTSGLNHSDTAPVLGRSVRPLLSGLRRLLEASSRTMENLLITRRLDGPSPPHGSPAAGHLMNEALLTEADDTHAALEGVIATHLFSQENDLTVDELLLAQDAAAPFCPVAPRPEGGVCSEQRYRSLRGTCNNLRNEKWGAAGTPLLRLLPPAYEDGVWAPRAHSVTGALLPGARVVSSTLFVGDDAPSAVATQMLTQFGQFVAHDVAFSPSIKHANGSGVSCCKGDGSGPLETVHFACLPITIPEDDPFFAAYGQTCMEFVRAALAPRRDCALGYAQQVDQVSHFIDGSHIYSTSEETLAKLRTFEGGKMKHTVDFGRVLLPQNEDSSACRLSDPGSACFLTGDTRGNQVAGLAVLHTLFLRHHNNLCGQLGMMNPHWDDETIFQEVRRIVVAQLQHIVYSEWLPVVLGEEAMLDFGLLVGEGGFNHTYHPDLDPSISSEFAAAAFRFGHSTVQDKLRLNKMDNSVDEIIALPEVMFNPSRMRVREFYDRYLNMLLVQPAQDVDNSITDGISKYLFRGGFPFGMDLISLNIQRGRDHGLKPYNAYRELAGLNKALKFDDFADVMPWSAITAIKKIYSSPDDVDLYVGGLLEKHEQDSLLGPTFIAIIGEQFSRLQQADRFFYAVKGMKHSFTKGQLEEIERTTMARLICDNSDFLEVHKIQTNVFLRPNLKGNSLVDCQSIRIPKIDLKPWKELK